MNEDIIEIPLEYSTENDDNFNSKYIYVNNIYTLKDNAEYDFDMDFNYQITKNYYIDSIATLDSICDLGKKILTRYNINNIDDVNRHYMREHLYNQDGQFHCELLREWLLLNPFPYCDFDIDDFLIRFFIDSITCYVIYDINKWLLKLSDNINDAIKEINRIKNKQGNHKDYIKYHEKYYDNNITIINNLKRALNFINFSNIIYTNDLDLNILNVSDNKEKYSDFYSVIEDYYLTEKAILNNDNIIEYINVIRRYLIGYVSYIIKNNQNNFLVTNQQPFYEPTAKNYRIISTATSLIGIAYNRLLINLTSTKESYTRRICANPTCNNEFETPKTRRRIYCKNIDCQRKRHAKNSNNNYHGTQLYKRKANQVD